MSAGPALTHLNDAPKAAATAGGVVDRHHHDPEHETVASFIDTIRRTRPATPTRIRATTPATIQWGDGATAGTIVPNGVGFDVAGTHALFGGEPRSANTADPRLRRGRRLRQGTTSHLTVFQFLSSGGFVTIGDEPPPYRSERDLIGGTWAQQQRPHRRLGAGGFREGFGDSSDPAPPACGGTFTAGPGDSSSYAVLCPPSWACS